MNLSSIFVIAPLGLGVRDLLIMYCSVLIHYKDLYNIASMRIMKGGRYKNEI